MTIQGIPDPGPGTRLHLNENTGGCSPRVTDAIQSLTPADLALYPDYKPAVLETARYLGIDPDWLVLTNGLDEGILLAAMAALRLEPGAPAVEAIQVTPAFEAYRICVTAMGGVLHSVPHAAEFAFPLEAVLERIGRQTRIIFINTPHNPSGRAVPETAIRRVMEAAPHATVMVDEAYHDFHSEHLLHLAREYPNVVIGRTFSKAFGLAGLRIGVLVAQPALLEPIRYVMPVYNLSVIAVAALRAALADHEFVPWYLSQVRESKALACATLDRLRLRFWPSQANFVLIDGGARARALVDGLHAERIFVRDRTRDPECPNCFRLTTGMVVDTRRALGALETLCAAPS